MKFTIAKSVLILILFSGTGFAKDISTLEQIKNSETVRIGYREDKPPMSFLNEHKQPVGYSIDLCLHIVDEIRSKLQNPNIAIKYTPVTASNRFEAIQNNTIDILCGSTTKTLSRSELVDFTQLSFITGASLVSLKTAKVEEAAGSKDTKIAVVKDTTTMKNLEKFLEKVGSETQIVPVASAEAGMDAVLKGDVDAFSSDQIVLIGLVAKHKQADKFIVSEKVYSYEPFALAIRQNDSEFRLLADRVLSRLNRTAQIAPIYMKWFGQYKKKVPPVLDMMFIINATPE